MFKFFGSKKHPKGPNFTKAKEQCLSLSGTKVFFTVPDTTHTDFVFKQDPDIYNLYDDSVFHNKTEKNDLIQAMNGSFSAYWSYRGFVLFKKIGVLSFGVSVDKCASFGSLFSHDNFVSAINLGLNAIYGPQSNHKKDRFIVRKNWFTQTINNINLVHYEVLETEILSSSRFWVAPITKEHYIYFVFHKMINANDTNLNQAYDELIEKVLASIRIELSADAAQQKAAAAEQWPDQELPEALPELTWSNEEWLAGESDKQRSQREYHEELDAIDIKHGKFGA